MKNFKLILIAVPIWLFCQLVPGQTEPAKINPEDVFEEVWQTLNSNYPYFEQRGINWQTMYKVYKPKINPGTTDEELFRTLCDMIEPFNDGHVNLENGKDRVGQSKEYISTTYHYLEPLGPAQYTRPVILLQNAYSASGSEAFSLAMKVLPHATSIGETTEGCFATFYPHKLINGWTVTMPWSYAVDQNDFCWEGIGVPPDLRKINTKKDIEAGNDKVLEFALDILKAGGNIRKEADGSLREMKISLVDQFVATSAKEGFKSAVNQYNKSKKTNPEGFYISIQELGVTVKLLLNAERNEDAFALLELGHKEFPENINILYFLARLYENLKKQPEKAQPIWEQIASLTPSFPWESNLVAEAKKSLGTGS